LIQVVDPAVPPDKRTFPKRSWIVAGGNLLGLMIGIVADLQDEGLESARASREFETKLSRLRQSLRWKHNSYGKSL
jgi:tyrosine-protein kinase Etk/Wzc